MTTTSSPTAGPTASPTASPTAGHWSTHQLTEYFAAVSAPDVEDDVLRIAVERAGESLEAEIGAVVVEDTVVACIGFGTTAPPSELSRLPLGSTTSTAERMGQVNYFSAPMNGPGALSSAVRGQIIVGRLDAPFGPDEQQMLQAMATVLGLVLRNLRSLAVERSRQNLLRSLLEVQRAISMRRPLQEVVDAVTSATSRLLGVATVSLVLTTDGDVETLRVASRHGDTDRIGDPLRDESVVLEAARLAMRTGSLVDASSESAVTVLTDLVASPVHLDNQITGALVAWKSGWGQASGMHAELTTMFAQQVSVALNDHHMTAKMQEALHDSLTGLASRALLHDRLEHACSVARRRRDPLGLLFIDLDEFKAVNDTHGHAAGDEVLVEVSRRLLDQLRATDTVARIGGDEFVVVLEGLTQAEALELAGRVLDALVLPMSVAGLQLSIGASIGIADGDCGRVPPARILSAADEAMYEAKGSPDGNICVYPASRFGRAG